MENIYNESNFETEVIKSPVPVLVDFWAPWCGPCRLMAPVIEELANEVDEARLKVGKVNVDESGVLAQTYGIMSIPSFLIFKDGRVVDQFSGSMQKDLLLEKVSKHF